MFLRAHALRDPLVISDGGGRATVVAVDSRAHSAGIRPGMAISAAYALAPQIIVQTRDPREERHALESIAAWAFQFTSFVSLAPPCSLLLEIGGSLRLFGGLDALCDRIRHAVGELGFDAVIAVAPTARGAFWLARAGLEVTIRDIATLRGHLQRLPVARLEIEAGMLDSLERIGVRTIGELASLPREGVARRFGQALLDQLDRAFGVLPDPQLPFSPPARFSENLVLPAPVDEVEALLFAAHRLVLQMTGWLSARNAGATRIGLALHSEDGETAGVLVALSVPSRDPKHLINLLRERLSITPLPGKIESIGLEALDTAQLAPRNFSFFPDREQLREEGAALVEKLRARLGDDSVHGLSLYPDARPELAWRESEPGASAEPAPRLARPAWLLARPRRLQLQAGHPWLDGRLAILDGPERIESGWWDGNDVQRDYFVARNDHGAMFWIYRDRTPPGDWFLHGIFA